MHWLISYTQIILYIFQDEDDSDDSDDESDESDEETPKKVVCNFFHSFMFQSP